MGAELLNIGIVLWLIHTAADVRVVRFFFWLDGRRGLV
jgi:hypothetical protein